jgi:hypothetical protein
MHRCRHWPVSRPQAELRIACLTERRLQRLGSLYDGEAAVGQRNVAR